MRAAGAIALLLILSACAAQDAQVPPFARVPYEPISRESVVAIARREWRLFGQLVDDGTPQAVKWEREPGLWQRVGEYWWLGLNANESESGWTGKHDGRGTVFPASIDGEFAWSAAFISYVMRIAGAGPRFPYAANHWTYIDRARETRDGKADSIFSAEPPEAYGPNPGDLICLGRGNAASMRYDQLPAGPFPAHCDIVVDVQPERLAVIGGNVQDAVSLKYVPTMPDGRLADANGTIRDPERPWLVVLRLRVDPVAASAR